MATESAPPPQPGAANRPSSVTALVVLTVISGVLDLIGGIVLLALAGNAELRAVMGQSNLVLYTSAVVSMIVGVVVILVGYLLRAGSPNARLFVSVLMGVRIVLAITGMVLFGLPQITESLVSIFVAAVVLVLLWNKKANTYFGP